GQHWRTHITRKAAETGAALTVDQLRKWTDEPRAMGLPKEAANLVILVFAAQTNRSFYLHGSPYEASLTNLPEKCELREQKLPGAQHWQQAVERAGSIFGIAASPLLNATNVSQLTASVKKKATDSRNACGTYVTRLRERMNRLAIRLDADRLKTASATVQLVDRLSNAEADSIVEALAAADVATSETAMGECVAKAAELDGNLDAAGWDIFEAISQLSDERRGEAQTILAEVTQAIASDEHVLQLAAALKSAQAKAVRLLTKSKQPDKEPDIEPSKPPEPPPGMVGKRVVRQGSQQSLAMPDAKKLLADLDEQVRPGQTIRVGVSWTIEEGG
ncbi:MAG: hypothetical protein ACREHD_28060, partial [Pirellulales bacterium]